MNPFIASVDDHADTYLFIVWAENESLAKEKAIEAYQSYHYIEVDPKELEVGVTQLIPNKTFSVESAQFI